MKNTLRIIIKKAIDIHVHIGPEILPRKYNVNDLVKSEKGKIGGFVLKNHFYPTTPLIRDVNNKGLNLYGSIVLNNAAGGLNPEAIYASSLITDKPIFVWFPTINAENFLGKSLYEIPKEWVGKKDFKARKSENIKPVIVCNKNRLSKNTISVLEAIKKYNAILATGHISWKEAKIVAEKAIELGIKRIVITHPIYQYIDMPASIQKKLAEKGCFIEQSYSMYSIDKIPIGKIAKQIKEIGSQYIILSSDVGQQFSPSPSEALYAFCILLMKEGINENELNTMLVINPRKLLTID